MIYLGSALMVYNIISYQRFFAQLVRQGGWNGHRAVLRLPVVLLVMFLLGYLAVGIFGNPDLIVSGILFGGSIFVFVILMPLRRIIDHIKANEHLQAQLVSSEESNRVKTSFLASVSHEVRTPMNAIIGLDNLALGDPNLSPTTRDYLEKLGASARQLLSLINNILDISHVESGHLVLQNDEFQLRDAVLPLCAEIRSRCERKGLSFALEMDEGVEGACIGDMQKLTQVLESVLDNAVKFTDAPGSVRLAIRQTAGFDDYSTFSFRVSDTGVGISPEYLPKVFEIFSQEDASSKNRFGGSGLGLPIAKNLVELMNGEITIESEKNVGTTVEFTVTLKRPATAAAEKDGSETGKPLSLAGARVLVVEDVELNAEIVMDILSLEEIESDHAENGQIAVDMFSASEPGWYDAILMDVRMPVMDGLAATRAIRALDRPDAKTVPIIALTANAFDEDIQNSLQAGMNAHLAKPAEPDCIYETLRVLTGRNGE